MSPRLNGLLSPLDATAEPCTDFYQYACGPWIRSVDSADPVVPRWTQPDIERDEALARMLGGEDETFAGLSASERSVVRSFYADCLRADSDDAQLQQQLAPLLQHIDTVRDAEDFWRVAGRLQRSTDGPLFRMRLRAAEPSLLIFFPDGLGLFPSVYDTTGDRGARIEAAYKERIAVALRRFGSVDDQAIADADVVWNIERDLAHAQSNDPAATPWVEPGRAEGAHRDALRAFLEGWDVGDLQLEHIRFMDEAYVNGLIARIDQTPAAELRAYLRWSLGAKVARPAGFEDSVALRDALFGKRPPRSRQAYCADEVNARFEMLSVRWHRERLRDEPRAALDRVYKGVQIALRTRVTADRSEALANHVGEDLQRLRWRLDSEGTPIPTPLQWNSSGAFVSDLLSMNAKAHAAYANLAGQDLRSIFAGRGGSFSDEALNEIVLWDGRLIPDAANSPPLLAWHYASAGTIFGHELVHAIDHAGEEFGWDKHAVGSQCLTEKYASVEANNRPAMLGEARADLGGIGAAYDAWALADANAGRCNLIEDSTLTHEQLFFVAYAQLYCMYASPEYAKTVIGKETSHAPGSPRVNTTLSLDPNFSRAFSCTAPDEASRCQIW